uniref:Unknown protein from spot 104 of 2D-PAGE of thylakoid (Fragments) n=1 Tax=Pisum sativum TaxID=3888 RepID=UT104_PEA|nr:RecName: Full=Unknown protein from spot 104 of 2D-PAGE of thylakoid [Pisum sativum]
AILEADDDVELLEGYLKDWEAFVSSAAAFEK